MKTIYNEELEQINFLDERFYKRYADQEIYYPSVTEILNVYPKGFGYTQWLKDLGSNANMVADRVKERGSRVHNAIEKYLRKEPVVWQVNGVAQYSLDEWVMILRFIDFYKEFKPKIIAFEIRIYHDGKKYAGTLDLVCEINSQRWLIDYKTGNIYKSGKIQNSVYGDAWDILNPDLKIDRLGILHLEALTRGRDKSGKTMQGEGWKLIEFTEDREHLSKLFDHTHALYLEENPIPKPKNKVYPAILQLEEAKNEKL